ncbi:MAG: NAD(P)H-dependent oxidoreductase [Phycisphaerae bacterium]|jgi:FMN-dependent NADH-azoreductase
MKTLLYIKSSPRDARSHSHKTASAFIEEYRRRNPNDKIEILDLFRENLPEFDNFAAESKYAIMHGQPKTAEQIKKWTQIEKIIERFKSADKYLLSTPMWNFSIPYKLKHYIDIIVQPSYTFTVSEKGYQGLVIGKPLCVVYSSGGIYEKDSPMDLQKKYVELIFRFMGFTDIKTIICPNMLADEETVKKAQNSAIEAAKTISTAF